MEDRFKKFKKQKERKSRKEEAKNARRSYNRQEKEKASERKRSKKVSTESQIESIRLNRYLANAGVCSRRQADQLIVDGEVKVNGEVITTLGFRVNPTDTILFKGRKLRRENYKYILLNKPKNYLTTTNDDRGRKTVMELLEGACAERIYPVGRLDRNTTGLLLFTNDGATAKKLTHPSYEVKKVYLVECDKPVQDQSLKDLLEGVELEDGQIKIDEIEHVKGKSKTNVVVTIHSGKNRIVRRMFEYLGYEVTKLDRISFAGLTKGSLTRGKFRHLTKREVGFLKMHGA